MPASEGPYPSVWARPPRQGRPGLTREQIVAEALRILDAEGIDALSMRKLSTTLGAGTASLYWHVANRDELLELVIDEVHGELFLPASDSADTWRGVVRQFADSMRATALRHPWLVSVFEHMVAAYAGPNMLRVAEHMVTVMRDAGFSADEGERALSTVTSYVIGIAMGEAAWHSMLARRGQSPHDWADESLAAAEQAVEDHPALGEVVQSYAGKDPLQAMDEDFAYGLDRVLDGLQARLDSLA